MIKFIAQLPMTLTQEYHEVSLVVLMQKNALNDLLIESDLQPGLGFRFTVHKLGNKETVLFVGRL